MFSDKMAAICPDVKLLGFRISDHIYNPSRLVWIADSHYTVNIYNSILKDLLFVLAQPACIKSAKEL